MTAFQSAYRKHHSTESALLNIHNDILLNMAKGSVTALTLLDLSAAFDQTCKQSNRSNRKVIDWSQLRCNSNRLKFFKCNSNSNRLKFYLLHLLLSIIFLLQFTLWFL